MDQQYGDFRLVDAARGVVDGNEHVCVFTAVRRTRFVER